MNFLHCYNPISILFSIGPINIHWYGFLMALAILAGLLVSLQVAKWHKVDKEIIYDLFFYVVIAGFIGARVFYVLYNFNYFWQNPIDIFKIWQGGIAIHGALIFGALTLWWFCRHLTPFPLLTKERVSKAGEVFWLLAAIIAPGLALGQAIGRWGNYFNQELFGLPTSLPWGIPIDITNRPAGFKNFEFFHPTFLYESMGDLAIFAILLLLHRYVMKRKKYLILNIKYSQLITLDYILLYSTLRLALEFLRIDPTAGSIGGVRTTMILTALGIAAGFILLLSAVYKKTRRPRTT
ncbi:prolipoprotein diacylglyceryl transferase [Candidatus Falkowbacteria bacterium RIFOXYA2_FULL_47_9]|uniref:Phosphatidylglycerol--prolipoprotein diacylglyceryl transferase n=1 Tax=Candidatus Falkowbacteria bacterium RIFOXYA2_FULL_47_9 TaxID=1797995 RepID=A0A1F5SQD0_9BACT|nr:MAG: prolipoprotein diacylglyceryl transferase [Candidatus Falkowbacteria bacterium RIFOXYA2_FULL_47_9]